MFRLAWWAAAAAAAVAAVAARSAAADASALDATAVSFSVLVYGSTPAGVLAAVAAARHGAGKVALLSQREHVGGMCSGGLGQTDIGGCADEVIGGLAKEFFERNAKRYATAQPRAPWNLEPHVAKSVFLEMLSDAKVTLLPPDEVASTFAAPRGAAGGWAGRSDAGAGPATIKSITTVGGATYSAEVFVDASYEGDMMARTDGVDYTCGREPQSLYNESGAGSQGTLVPYGIEYMDPYDDSGNLLPLLNPGMPLPKGEGDKQIQAYNFRLCVTDNATLRVPFDEPPGYNASRWELLRRFWLGWPNSTNPHKQAQAAVPTAILGAIPSTLGARKFDANNCGYNPIHTDMIGGSWGYPEANYSQRQVIWQQHVDYTRGFLWFMSSDPSVPETVRNAYRYTWGYCGDEFADTTPPHFPPQLYIREARRLVGDKVLTQGDVQRKAPLGNFSVGMGCYNFDSHCEERYACSDPKQCTLHPKPYVAIQCGCNVPNPGTYQMPLWVLFPKRAQVGNLLVPVCSSASHVAYATIRMEPQFMILGEAAGVVAALTVRSGAGAAVQDVDPNAVAAALLADGAILAPGAPRPPSPPSYGCQPGGNTSAHTGGVSSTIAGVRCLLFPTRTAGGKKGPDPACGGACAPLQPREWLALKAHYYRPSAGALTLRSVSSTVLKKSEALSQDLPANATQRVGPPAGNASVTLWLSRPPASFDGGYWLIECAQANCSAPAA